MKKVIALLLAVVMLLAMALTGCSSAPSGATKEDAPAEKAEKTEEKTEKEEAASTEPVALKVWIPEHTRVEDFNKNEMTTWLEEQGNFDLEITTIPSEDFMTKVNMALTVGDQDDLPDVILGGDNNGFSATSIQEWADTGTIIPLTEYYKDPDMAVHINKAIERTGVDYTAQLVMPDGELYSIGTFNQSYGNEYPAKLFIYEPWLEALHAQIPTTTDEFEALLKQVAATDLNGNGKSDEIPFIGASQSKTFYMWFQDVMNPFVYAGDTQYRVVENGKVSAAYTTEQWRAGLQYIHNLFAEGLIPTETLTMIDEQYSALINTEDHTVFAFSFMTPSKFTNSDISSKFIAIEPLIGPEGVQYATYRASCAESRFVITSNCDNPEAAFRFGDLLSSEYIGISQRWGLEGTNWDYVENAKDADAWDAPYENFDLYVIAYDDNSFWRGMDPTSACWMQDGVYVRQYAIANGIGVPSGSVSEFTTHVNEANSLYQEGGYAPEETIANLIYTEDEAMIISETESTLKTYVEEYIGAVLMGNKNLDSDWDAFQSELEAIGLSDYLAAVQSAYDRMYK